MPTKPQTTTLDLSGVNADTVGPDIMNAVRNSATPEYRAVMPMATADNVREIGNVFANYEIVQNEFVPALINRIAFSVVTSRVMDNPLRMFQRGLLRTGETIQEIFVKIAQAHRYNPEDAEETVFKRTIPDIDVLYHRLNYQAQYQATEQFDTLRQAFVDWNEVVRVVGDIVESMYSACWYDEFQATKYMMAKAILSGDVNTEPLPANYTPEQAIQSIKGITNLFPFPSTRFNAMGELTSTPWRDLILIKTASFDAEMSVNLLNVIADGLNVDGKLLLGNQVLIDSFANIDQDRLSAIVGPSFVYLTDAELAQVQGIGAMLVDRNWFMIFNNLFRMGSIYNPKGLYWNYFVHNWKVFSYSKFVNAVAFGTPVTPAPTPTINVFVNGGTTPITTLSSTVQEAQSTVFTAEVVGQPTAGVHWGIASTGGTTGVSINPNTGVISYLKETGGTYTVTAYLATNPAVKTDVTWTVTTGR